MTRTLLCLLVVVFSQAFLLSADPPKDTPSAAFTRLKKLKGKVSVDFTNEFLSEFFKEISGQLDDQKLGRLSVTNELGVSLNTRTTFKAEDQTVEEVLDGLLKTLDLGYVVVSREKDRYDGWIRIVKGPQRGYEKGMEPVKTTPPVPDPKPETPKTETKPTGPPKPAASEAEEKMAKLRLDLAKELLEKGNNMDAKPLLKYVVKYFPTTKAAEEAKTLIEQIMK